MTFKKRAPRAIKEIRSFAEHAMVSLSHQSITLLHNVVNHLNTRAPRTSVSTPSWTRRSGNAVSRACLSVSVSASRVSVTTRRAPRRSSTLTSRPSTSRSPRVSKPPLLTSKLIDNGHEKFFTSTFEWWGCHLEWSVMGDGCTPCIRNQDKSPVRMELSMRICRRENFIFNIPHPFGSKLFMMCMSYEAFTSEANKL